LLDRFVFQVYAFVSVIGGVLNNVDDDFPDWVMSSMCVCVFVLIICLVCVCVIVVCVCMCLWVSRCFFVYVIDASVCMC
jgi:hypothetical protein